MVAVESSETTETVVLLNLDGEAIGVAPKATVHGPRTPLHLAFSCYVFDASDRLLVTRRSFDKRTWPGVLTNTCCGHPALGEAIPAAISRRLADELGLRVQNIRLVLPTFRYRSVMEDGTVENEICPVFSATTSEPFQLNPEEVAEAYWTPWSTFVGDVSSGSLGVSPWCRMQVGHLRALGPSPRDWPTASEEALPTAARESSPVGSPGRIAVSGP
ncbi:MULTISPECIES: isopentenyl-diphosphate Delta-isomerase [unclassified Pseudofrankia]|uniref:isopentenyl-diphosphate Delta-isomerase n=1 Tax=unclassified Pseudofrankia TaxID=2994372 RepID=UPI0009F1C96B|nr:MULTISPECIES: isopentenyl-diphosphate Delta-isomerase [unclassified Pseudofrankia]MDT3442986.1 isopentenyl-diphosphate Delta-isomerase [Pseudofrankia sp. BMG5.37]